MKKDLSNMRENYKKGILDVSDINQDPFAQFQKWFNDAIAGKVVEPNAMTLSTVNKNGHPSSRIVLLKEVDDQGFVFFTNYDSKKGQEIHQNDNVAINFFWRELERQVQIQGKAKKISETLSESYFHSRPFGSQIGAISSNQSSQIENRARLEEKYSQNYDLYKEQGYAPFPNNWGGFIVTPSYFEFWQGRESRLHDRFEYLKKGDNWQINRLEP